MLLGKHNKRKLAVTIGSISLAALLLAACGQKEQQKSSIDVSINAELQTLDPSHIVESTGDEVLKNTQEGLLTVGKHNKLLPGIAKSWHVSADSKTYTFNLRHDAKWNNGQAITAADFVYSWQRIVNPQTKSENAYRLAAVVNGDQITAGKLPARELGVTAKSKYQFVVHMQHPVAPFLQQVAEPAMVPVQKSIVTKYGKKFGTDAKYVSSDGPFILKKWHGNGDSWTLVRNKNYWNRGKVYLTAVTYHVLKGADTRLNMFESGELDQTTLTGSQVANEQHNKAFVNVPSGSNVYVQFNQKNPASGATVKKALNNVNIRKALSLSLNRKEFVNKTLNDGSTVAKGLVTSGMGSLHGQDFANAAYLKDPANNGVSYDKTLAQQLFARGLKEIGASKLNLSLTADDDDTHDTITQYLQGAWTANLKGLHVTIKKVPKPTRIKDMLSGNFDTIVAGWSPDADPASFLDIFAAGNPYNIGYYNNAAFNKQVKIAGTTANAEKRWTAMVKAEQIIMTDQGVLPIYQSATAYLRNPKLQHVIENPAGSDPGWRGVRLAK